ncbi:MAG: hypothetical protein OQJ91_17795 [Motiliproteus sp.]|nr:hypothetical protein [Motiliproteus sp.]
MSNPAISIPAVPLSSPNLASTRAVLESAAPAVQQQVTLSVLKQAIEFEGELALQLLPQPGQGVSLQSISGSNTLGQSIDILV